MLGFVPNPPYFRQKRFRFFFCDVFRARVIKFNFGGLELVSGCCSYEDSVWPVVT